jgi:RND family efflux transporter MFP subunit
VLDVSKKEPGLVPQQEVDEAHSRDLVAEAQVSGAKSRITASEQRIRVSQAEQARVKTLFQYATISAPFAGVVTKRYANSGSLIQAGTASQSQAMPVVRLSENGLLRLALPVPESAVPLIRLGEPVDVRVSALHRSFPGRVARFSDKVDESTRTMKTEVDVPNPTLVLVPGMYAEVDLVTEQQKHVLTVPVEAIDGAGSSARVFTVQPSGTIQIVPVGLGIETARQIEIRSGDLKDGDDVVVGSRSGLKDGNKVQPKVIRLASDATLKP